jgi:DNA invertase Pin-like site-specific DNA recombinase
VSVERYCRCRQPGSARRRLPREPARRGWRRADRLARSTTDLLALEAGLSRREVGLIILGLGGATLDTRNPTSKLMLTILAGVATWEREIMLERQREGIARAVAAEKSRRRAAEIQQLHAAGVKPAHIARQLGVARSSVYLALKAPPAGPAHADPLSAVPPPRPRGGRQP